LAILSKMILYDHSTFTLLFDNITIFWNNFMMVESEPCSHEYDHNGTLSCRKCGKVRY